MKRDKKMKIRTRTVLSCIGLYIVALISGGLGYYAITRFHQSRVSSVLILILLLAAAVAALFIEIYSTKKTQKKISELTHTKNLLKSVIDAVPFPIHVTDNNMKWTLMNKDFEQTLIRMGAIKDRESSYGKPCSNAGASICNTEKCGIRQLQQGVGESYFEWGEKSCKQNTAYLVDESGARVGYVETVEDLTSIIRVNRYNKAQIEKLISNLQKLAQGNVNLDMTTAEADEYTKESKAQFEKINQSLAEMKDALSQMIGDTKMLCAAAAEGKLDVKADAAKHKGEYRAIIEGMNTMEDEIVKPLNAANSFIANLEAGAHQEDIPDGFKGSFAVLADNLNSLRRQMATLVSEGVKLAEAGAAGDLSFRADTSSLKGGNHQIIDGFNKTVDAIIVPVNEASEVLEKMAVNDFSVKMSDNYKGDMAKLAKSINDVRSGLLDVQNRFTEIADGKLDMLERLKSRGKLSENDSLTPAAISMMEAIESLANEATELADAASKGNLSKRQDAEKFKGAYKQIIEGMNGMMEAMEVPLDENFIVLKKLSDGDLTADMVGQYEGKYEELKNSMNATLATFNDLLEEINQAAEQVASGSKQVADGSQELSQGATEQATSIEQLTSSVTQIAAQTKQNASNAGTAKKISDESKDQAIQGNTQMKQMLNSMKEISEASSNIYKIIKVIDDIAFQTNILSLNAAVEAARAGNAGKGFAVVAEEVRNLAGRSAKAAKDTTELIESTIKKVEAGSKIADTTAAELEKIVTGIEKANSLVNQIAEASSQQSIGISQVEQGIEQVSTVMQANSATSEQSATASEELTGQAKMLQDMVAKFKLKQGKNTMASKPQANQKFTQSHTAETHPFKQQKENTMHAGTKPQSQLHKTKPVINLGSADFGKY